MKQFNTWWYDHNETRMYSVGKKNAAQQAWDAAQKEIKDELIKTIDVNIRTYESESQIEKLSGNIIKETYANGVLFGLKGLKCKIHGNKNQEEPGKNLTKKEAQ